MSRARGDKERRSEREGKEVKGKTRGREREIGRKYRERKGQKHRGTGEKIIKVGGRIKECSRADVEGGAGVRENRR